jgi:hypothetical protein
LQERENPSLQPVSGVKQFFAQRSVGAFERRTDRIHRSRRRSQPVA